MQTSPHVWPVQLRVAQRLPQINTQAPVIVVVHCGPRSLMRSFLRRFRRETLQVSAGALHAHFIHKFVHFNAVLGVAPFVL